MSLSQRIALCAGLVLSCAHCGGSSASSPPPGLADAAASAADGASSDGGTLHDASPTPLDAGLPATPGDAATPLDEGGTPSADASGPRDATTPAGHCAPGKFYSIYDFSTSRGGVNQTFPCYGADMDAAAASGVYPVETAARRYVESVELEQPIRAGQRYAGSVLIGYDGVPASWYIEVWGTNAQCAVGTTSDRLLQKVMVEGEHVYCFEVLPLRDYTHWLIVYKDVDGLIDPEPSFIGTGEATFCPAGSCPM